MLRDHRALKPILIALAIVLVGSMSSPPSPVAGATLEIVVNTDSDVEADDGLCSLREAITAANERASSGTREGECLAGTRDSVIRFALPLTIKLTKQLPAIATNLSIIGVNLDSEKAQPRVVIDGDWQHRILAIRSGNVRISRVHFQNGLAQGGPGGAGYSGSGGGGGGAGMGGAVFIVGGRVTFEESRFTGNRAIGGRGGDSLVVTGVGFGGGGGGIASAPADSMGGDGTGQAGGSGGKDGQIFSASATSGDGWGGAGAGPSSAGVGGFGGFGGGGGGAGSGGTRTGYAGAGGFGGGGGGGAVNGASSSGGNGGGTYGGGGGVTYANAPMGGGGGGGAGLGGAIFVKNGSHTLIDCVFLGNSAEGNLGGTGVNVREGVNGRAGSGAGYGGAVFVAPEAMVYNISRIETFPDSSNVAGTVGNLTTEDWWGPFQSTALVSVAVTQVPSISGPTHGIFELRRRGPIGAQLRVTVELGGSARLGATEDYTATIGAGEQQVIFEPDEATKRVTIYPRERLEAAGRTVTLTVYDNPTSDAYVVDATPQASTTIERLPPPTWLVLLYVAADDIAPRTLNSDERFVSLSEPASRMLTRLAAQLPPNPHLRLVILYDGKGDDDTRVLVRQPGVVEGLEDVTAAVAGSSLWPGFPYDARSRTAEVDSGRPETLRNFIAWARDTYPQSKHTMLSIIDHGGGWAPDLSTQVGQPKVYRLRLAGESRGLSVDYRTGSALATRDTSAILAALGERGQFDIIFFDACLMGMVESAYEIQPYAKYFIAGQSLLWAELPYHKYLAGIDASTTPRALSQKIVSTYGDDITEPHTVAAINTARLPTLRAQVDRLAELLFNELPRNVDAATTVKRAYEEALKFDADVSMTLDPTDSYIDLYEFADTISRSQLPPEILLAAQDVMRSFDLADPLTGARLIEQLAPLPGEIDTPAGAQAWEFNRAHGLSIYMPLGERDCRLFAPRDGGLTEDELKAQKRCSGLPVPADSNLSYIDHFVFYRNREQLAFTRDATFWPRLIEALSEKIQPPLPRQQPHEAHLSYPPYQLRPSTLKRLHFLPVLWHELRPDLEVVSVEIVPAQLRAGAPAEIILSVRNNGPGRANQKFWVDLYVNPGQPPIPNKRWNDLAPAGAAWAIEALAPGETVILSTKRLDLQGRYSDFSSFQRIGTNTLYVLVDSYEQGSANGAVIEYDESNNLKGPLQVTVRE